jgi:hypothetical protein
MNYFREFRVVFTGASPGDNRHTTHFGVFQTFIQHAGAG